MEAVFFADAENDRSASSISKSGNRIRHRLGKTACRSFEFVFGKVRPCGPHVLNRSGQLDIIRYEHSCPSIESLVSPYYTPAIPQFRSKVP